MSAVIAMHHPSLGVVPSNLSTTTTTTFSSQPATMLQTTKPSITTHPTAIPTPIAQSSSLKSTTTRPTTTTTTTTTSLSSKTKHRKINKQHPEFELTYDMMLGIRTVVSKAEAQPNHAVNEKDYTDTIKLQFPGRGSVWTPAHRMRDFKFKDYSPVVYKKIRESFGINPADYLLCVCGNFQYLEFISNSKSGQFFFYTHDRQYMIKTVSKLECKFLQAILPAYYEHIVANPHTLLTKFFGMHRVKPHKKTQRHFLIMSSVFYTDKYIHTVFDLKGSSQGRSATVKEIKSGNPVYKDNDFLAQKVAMRLSDVQSVRLQEQLARDVEFLRKLDIMDYSLLLGIHYKDRPVPAVDRQQQQMEMTRSGVYSINDKDRAGVGAVTAVGVDKNSRDGSFNAGAPAQIILSSQPQQPRGSGSVLDGRAGESEQSETDGEGATGKRPSGLVHLDVPRQPGEAETVHRAPSPVSHNTAPQLAVDEHKQPIEQQPKAETVMNHQPPTSSGAVLPEVQRNPAVLLPPLAVNTALSTSSSQPHSTLPPSSTSNTHMSPPATTSPVDIPSPVPEETNSPPETSPRSAEHAPAWHSEPDDSPGVPESEDDSRQREADELVSPHSQNTLNIASDRVLQLRDLHVHIAGGEGETEERKSASPPVQRDWQSQSQPDTLQRAADSLSATQPLPYLSQHRSSLSASSTQPITLHLPTDGHGQSHYHTEDLSHLQSQHLPASAPPTQRSASVNLPHLLTVPTSASSALSSPHNTPHSPVSTDYGKRQSTYGLPKRWNKTTKPSDIDFDAPEFEPLPVSAALDSPRNKRERQSFATLPADTTHIPPPHTAVVTGGGVEVSMAAAAAVDMRLLTEHGGIGSVDGKEIYFMGIIDILTVYTMSKFMENRYKRARLQKGISAVSPRKYAERFKEFIAKGIRVVSAAGSSGGSAAVGSGVRAVNGVAK